MKVVVYALVVALIVVVAPAVRGQEPETGLRVAESGVGTAVEARELKGKATSFPEGSSVSFWTRVVGGQAGDRIVHVWIHDGKETSIGLSIGGSHWRTHSTKRLHPGLGGNWVVEARSSDGRVLAREEFISLPTAAGSD